MCVAVVVAIVVVFVFCFCVCEIVPRRQSRCGMMDYWICKVGLVGRSRWVSVNMVVIPTPILPNSILLLF